MSGDLRVGGRWTAAQAFKNFWIALVVRAAFCFADRLPEPVLLRAGRMLGRIAARWLRGAQRAALRRASACLPGEEASRVSMRCFECAGENLARSVLLRRPAFRAASQVGVSAASRAALERALARGRGVVFVSAHLGPFELVAARVAEMVDAAAIVVRESYDPALDRWVDAHRESRGLEVIHRGAAGAALRIVRALRRGRPVGFLPDLGGRVSTRNVEFLGRTVAFPDGPQKIAHRAHAPIVIGTLTRRSSERRSVFELEMEELEANPSEKTIDELTQRVAFALARAILKSPEDWLWMAGPLGEKIGQVDYGKPMLAERLLIEAENG